MDLKFIQDLHNKEFERKESLAQRASMIIAGLTTLGGVLAFLAVNFKSEGRLVDFLFWLLAAASVAAFLWSAFYLIWSYRVPPLNDIARPKEWLSYWRNLQKEAEEGKLPSAEARFTEYLLNQYATIGDGNIDTNFKRGTRLLNSNNRLLASFVLIVLTSLTFYVGNYIIPVSAHTVREGANNMITFKDAFVCVPAPQILNAGGEKKDPQPRPVPMPQPPPGPRN